MLSQQPGGAPYTSSRHICLSYRTPIIFTSLMHNLESTIHEALSLAPPEHQELALAALIEARFNVWPRGAKIPDAQRTSRPRPKTSNISE